MLLFQDQHSEFLSKCIRIILASSSTFGVLEDRIRYYGRSFLKTYFWSLKCLTPLFIFESLLKHQSSFEVSSWRLTFFIRGSMALISFRKLIRGSTSISTPELSIQCLEYSLKIFIHFWKFVEDFRNFPKRWWSLSVFSWRLMFFISNSTALISFWKLIGGSTNPLLNCLLNA